MPLRTLTARQLSHLRRLGDAIRRATSEQAAAITVAVEAARTYHDGGTDFNELARALGVSPIELRDWIDNRTPKTQPPPTPAVHHAPPSKTGHGVLACTGHTRPRGNDFAQELSTIRAHVEPRFILVERTMIEIAELAPSINTHRPTVLHLAAHSSGDSVFLSRLGAPAAIPPRQIIQAITAAAHRPRILVLNFCASVTLVPQLAHLVPAIIYWPDSAPEDPCHELADLLYRGLTTDQTVTASMDAARITLPRHGLTRNQLPNIFGDGTTRLG